jgi:ligand-binding SRPBCC domain-containing protein
MSKKVNISFVFWVIRTRQRSKTIFDYFSVKTPDFIYVFYGILDVVEKISKSFLIHTSIISLISKQTQMKINIETAVNQSVNQVWEQFDEKLLMQLSPPFPPVKLISFGQKIGEKVTLELNFFIIRQLWVSIITDFYLSVEENYFIDEGVQLPFFLKYWKHKHRIVKNDNSGSKIIDEIEFRTPTILTDYIFYPILYLQFLYRKPIYRKLFKIPTP